MASTEPVEQRFTLDLDYLGFRLRRAREDAGLEWRDLATLLDVSVYTIRQFENPHRSWGRLISLDRLAKIADATNQSITSFFLPTA